MINKICVSVLFYICCLWGTEYESFSLPNKPTVQKKDEEFEKAKGDMLNPMQNFLNIQKTLDF